MFCYPYGLPVSTVPGPCDPEDLIDGIIFAANYLGSTQLLSERTPTKSARMHQAQEAMSRVRVRRTHTHTHRPVAVSSGGLFDTPVCSYFRVCSIMHTPILHSITNTLIHLRFCEVMDGKHVTNISEHLAS